MSSIGYSGLYLLCYTALFSGVRGNAGLYWVVKSYTTSATAAVAMRAKV